MTFAEDNALIEIPAPVRATAHVSQGSGSALPTSFPLPLERSPAHRAG